MNANIRPVEERIASLIGRTAYVDLREGLGGTCPLRIRDQDIAAALGWVSQTHGRITAAALETYYGSTLLHYRTLMAAWESREGEGGRLDSRGQLALARMAGSLAIHQLAGAKHGTTEYAEYAYLIVSRRDTLQARVREASSWLDELRHTGLCELRSKLRSIWEEQKKKREKSVA